MDSRGDWYEINRVSAFGVEDAREICRKLGVRWEKAEDVKAETLPLFKTEEIENE